MRRLPLICLLLLLPGLPGLMGQNVPGSRPEHPHVPLYFRPYAGTEAPRTGISIEEQTGRAHLAIRGTLPLYSVKQRVMHFNSHYFDGGHEENGEWVCNILEGDLPQAESDRFAVGLELFGSSSLPSEASSLRSEPMAYYGGLYAAMRLHEAKYTGTTFIPSARLAGLATNSVSSPDDSSTNLSHRARADMMLAAEFTAAREHVRDELSMERLLLRPYVGLRYDFLASVESMNGVMPYAGFDLGWQFHPNVPLSLRSGYECNGNVSDEANIVHSVRAGIKLAGLYENGIVLEWEYRSENVRALEDGGMYSAFGLSVEY